MNFCLVGPTPKHILQAGGVNFENLDLVIKAKTVGKMHLIWRFTGNDRKTSEILEAPKAIYHSASGASGSSVVVMTFEGAKGLSLDCPDTREKTYRT